VPAKVDITRRTFLKSSAAFIGSASLVPLAVAAHEPYEISIEQMEIKLPRLHSRLDGFRLVVLSDIHFGEFTQILGSAVEKVNALVPDLVVILGDFVTDPSRSLHGKRAANQAWPCAEILRTIRPRHQIFATLGNHDYKADPEIVIEALQQNGITVLRNRSVAIERDGARFWLAGVDDALESSADPERTLDRVPRNEAVIAAVHEPDFADEMKNYGVDFQISGHSHGGQVRLPALGAVYLPRMGTKYPMGLRRVGGMQLYTNRGLGVVGVPFRLMCPPEVTLFTLRAAG
jgi:predicted MPP superfamily phosphohydrolase